MATLSDVRALNALVNAQVFNASYYAHSFGRPYQRDREWLAFFDAIAQRIASEIQPQSVLDAGCALGLLVETLRLRGVDAFGVDLSSYAIDHVHEPFKPFCRCASVTEPLATRYDLIVSIEVVEHMPPAEADAAIANFCAHTNDVLFSSSPLHFGEPSHLNVRPPEYWASQFARYGFYRDVDFDASFVTAWAVRFRQRGESVTRLAADYERALARLSMERSEVRAKVLALQTALAQMAEAKERFAQLLAQSTNTIEHMERSFFWRARKPWAWLTRQLGRTE
jgi:SAM-dependent methyltransferase